ncbi:hypothetical protein HDV01_005721 [Terramyces sp. JEL0728]|nr:hypothetical protein HDV01_005721 [Terramyces sp. JEL0728]
MDYEIQKPNNFNDYLQEQREFKIKNKEEILNDLMERQIQNKRKHEITGRVKRNQRLDLKKPKIDDDYYALPDDIYQRGSFADTHIAESGGNQSQKKELGLSGQDAYNQRLQKSLNTKKQDADNQRLQKSLNTKKQDADNQRMEKTVDTIPRPAKPEKKFLLELRNIDKTEYLEEDLKELQCRRQGQV